MLTFLGQGLVVQLLIYFSVVNPLVAKLHDFYDKFSNSNCSECQMRTYKVTRGLHYDTDATMAVPEPYLKQLLHLISCERYEL